MKRVSWLTKHFQFRVWFFDKLGMLGQLPDSTREEAGKLREEAKQKLQERRKAGGEVEESPAAN